MVKINKVRVYVPESADSRVEQYAENEHIRKEEAYNRFIQNELNEDGTPRNKIVLLDYQHEHIKNIASAWNETPEHTMHSLLDWAMMVFMTDMPIRDVLVRSAPLMMDRIVATNPEIAKGMLKTLMK